MAKLTLILLPGLDGTGDLFGPLIKALGGEFTVQVVRYPTVGSLGYEALELVARKSLPSNEPFVILGESFSGPVAISIAASQPPGLLGVVMCSTFVRNPRPAFSALGALTGVMPVKLAPLGLLSYFLLGSHSTEQLRSSLAATLAKVSTIALRARVKAVLGVDVSAKLNTLKAPLLYLLATQDRVVPRSAVEEIARTLPAAWVVSINAPHFLLQVAPEAAASAIRAFMREVQNAT